MDANIQEIEETVGHRPWPLPEGRWIMFQSWRRLLFAHWPVAAATLRELVPAELELDTFEGQAWVSLTPFDLWELRVRGLPPVPGAGRFPELNLRTYVTVGGRPGIWFFSLDAGSTLAVLGARMFVGLPYHRADMRIEHEDDWVRYTSRRREGQAHFRARYRAVGPDYQARPGSLDHFLAERYALYVVRRDASVIRQDIHHLPWTLRDAEATIEVDTVSRAAGLALAGPPHLLRFARRLDTLVWPPTEAT
jgi:hypothetical protein